MTITISIVEDEKNWRDHLKRVIGEHQTLEILDVYQNCEKAIVKLGVRQPDILILDIELPGMNGIQAAEIIKRKWQNIKIVMFTVLANEEMLIRAIQNGASGYLLKNTPADLLISELTVLSQGGAPISASLARNIIGQFQAKTDAASLIEPLTPRENEVLALLALDLKYKEIAENLGVSPHTIRRHIENIYSKLHVNSRHEAVAHHNSQNP